MIDLLRNWYRRYFQDPQTLVLLLLLTVGLILALTAGDLLAPLLVSALIAYILEGVIRALSGHLPRFPAFLLVYLLFLASAVLIIFRLVPLLSEQVVDLAVRLPNIVSAGQQWMQSLPEQYPELISPLQVEQVLTAMRTEVVDFGERVIRFSLDTVVDLLTIVVYVVLVPILVFFLLKDKAQLLAWAQAFLPERQSLSTTVWREMDQKVTRYLRGKLLEIVLVWGTTFVVFVLFGLQYALLLSFLVGLSVIIPYVGAVAVTLPVLVIALFQWGPTAPALYLMIAYLAVQFLDGNLLVPLLFSEVVNLHPVAILVAILIFGGLWGVWGVLFAIPLASLVDVVLRTWPKHPRST